MAIEQGLVQLLQANNGVAAIVPAPQGGWRNQLPPEATLPNWSYTSVFKSPKYGLVAQPGLCEWRVQIDCYSAMEQGPSTQVSANALTSVDLANAIYAALSGYKGTLPDAQSTQVDSAFLIDEHSEFDSVRRTWRTMMEWRIFYFIGPSNPPD